MNLKVAIAQTENGYIAKCVDLINYEYFGKTKEEAIMGMQRLIHGLQDKRYKFQIDNCEYGKSILNAGCEIDPAMLKHRFNAVNFDIYQYACGCVDVVGDITDMPFGNHSFDIVVACDILEHIKDYKKAISEIRRVAKEKIVITIPTIDYEEKIGHEVGEDYENKATALHVWQPTFEEVKSIFPTAEFHDLGHWIGCFIVEEVKNDNS